jgi:hypothetical protein
MTAHKIETDIDFDSLEDRKVWPFSKMEVDQVISYSKDEDNELAISAQAYCHVYGKSTHKKFATKTVIKDGERLVLIKRVK